VTDSRMNRVKGLLSGPPGGQAGMPIAGEAPDQGAVHHEGGRTHQALQVLTLAQRTADEHLATARAQAEKIRADAQAAAEQIAREAQAHAENVRQDANKMLADARDAAAQIAREAQKRSAEAQRSAEKVVADAQAHAETIAADAQASAEELKLQAEQRYQDVVGSLATKREALQQQIEALEVFDREYRARLTTFMQSQLRALWVDQPQVGDEIGDADAPAAPAGEPATVDVALPAQRNGTGERKSNHRAS